jgi:hypothetical protein
MVIGERFAWAHLPKTGGSATLELFKLFPELIVFGDFDEGNAKHALFREREDQISGKALAMNSRRLPFWVLSRAQHVARWGIHPDYTPIPLASPEELANSDFPDNRLGLYTDGGRLRIERWVRMERLVEDFLEFISEFTSVTEERRQAALALPPVNAHDYDHELASWFTPAQIERVYERNPIWASLEQKLYGGLFELPVGGGETSAAAGPESAAGRQSSI